MATVQAHTFELPFTTPYAFDELLRFLAARAITCVELVSEELYTRSFCVENTVGVLSVAQSTASSLCVTVSTDDQQVVRTLRQRLRRLFDLDAQPRDIAAQLCRDSALAPLIERRPGLRVPGAWDGLELCVRAILGQQITVRAATQLCSQLVHALGTELPAAFARPGVTHLFPTAARLANHDLAFLKMPGARRAALTSLARSVLESPDLLAPRNSLPETIAALCSLRGIGPWTAHYIAMRALREPDAFPEGDVALLRALSLLRGAPCTKRELSSYAERWRPYRAYAALQLWASLHDHAR